MKLRSFVLLFALIGCSVRPSVRLADAEISVDYNNLDLWAAHPAKLDSADATPSLTYIDNQGQAEVDVFFLHPTTYTGDRQQKFWNAPLHDQGVAKKTDETTILHQASIFNGAGRVYAPRYRQAHLYAYFTKKNQANVRTAFELAYQDVRASFVHYLENFNEGRPIIIAAHSQGSTHGMRLLREFFDGKELQKRLVVAYLVGMPVKKDFFAHIKPCSSPEEIACFCSWRTFKSGYTPRKLPLGDSIAVTNPLSWSDDSEYAGHQQNNGGVLQKFHKGTRPNLTDAKIVNGMLWASKPKFPGSFLMTFKNYHVADYNLYWVNVRENAIYRSERYLGSVLSTR